MAPVGSAESASSMCRASNLANMNTRWGFRGAAASANAGSAATRHCNASRTVDSLGDMGEAAMDSSARDWFSSRLRSSTRVARAPLLVSV